MQVTRRNTTSLPKPTMPHSIRPLTIERYDEIISLWKHCEGVGLSAADSRESINSYLQRNPGMSFMAESSSDDSIIGTILAGHDGRRGYIHHLAVVSNQRRQGIARQLVERSLDSLHQAGIHKCHLFIMEENNTGIAFWKSVDWKLRSDIKIMSIQLEPESGGRC